MAAIGSLSGRIDGPPWRNAAEGILDYLGV